jgi:hypothetical protein
MMKEEKKTSNVVHFKKRRASKLKEGADSTCFMTAGGNYWPEGAHASRKIATTTAICNHFFNS